LPIASPKTSTIKSENPFMTFGWSPKPSAELTIPRTLTAQRNVLLGAGRLDVDHGALNNALEGRGRRGVVAVWVHQTPKLVVDVIGETLF
jgi:hypothetical protein